SERLLAPPALAGRQVRPAKTKQADAAPIERAVPALRAGFRCAPGIVRVRAPERRRQRMNSNQHRNTGNPAGQRLATEGATALAGTPEPITREQRRSRRKREVRARTISVKRMTKRELEIGRLLYPETDYWKPRTRAECVDGPRPCPFVSCRHHLYVD